MSGPLTAAPPTQRVADILERSQDLIAPALDRILERLKPQVATMAAFALGRCDVEGNPSAGALGKAVRPAIALLAAQGVGASAKTAVPGAIAVELVHTFTLVHDDIMDGDERRRHRESVWKAYGTGPAILAGDALLALAVKALTETAHPAQSVAVDMIASALVELVNGQAQDVSFEARPWTGPGAVTVEEYTAMAAGKTGSLLGCAAGLGALLGGASPATVSSLTTMGRHLGLAFQAVDDLLGIWGDPAVTGKPVYGDLRLRKKTLPVLFALGRDTPPAGRLARLLRVGADTPPTEDRLHDLAALITAAGGRAFATAAAERHLGRSFALIDALPGEAAHLAALHALARFIVNRSN